MGNKGDLLSHLLMFRNELLMTDELVVTLECAKQAGLLIGWV